MAVFIAQNMAPIMFAALVVFLLLGYPVAFSLGAVGLIFFVIGVELAPLSGGAINLSWPLLQSLPERIYGVMNNETLLAIPFFTFMGLILERSGMAEDLLETIGQLFGTIRGGLAYAVIFVGALLAATTGIVAASVISMGLISLPIMLRYGYDRRLASGVIAASGTLAQIIPPSLVLIVMADQLGRSVGDMYEAAFLPGLALAGLYAVYVFLVSSFYPSAAPGLPPEQIGFREADGSRGLLSLLVLTVVAGLAGWLFMRDTHYAGADRVILTMAASIAVAFAIALVDWLVAMQTGKGLLSRIARRVTFVMVPPLFLIFLVLGTIFIGVATPTEGGAMGAVGAMILAAAKRYFDGDARRFNFMIVRSAAEATAKLSAFVMFILIGARIFSLTFYGVNGHLWVEHLLTSLPGGLYGFLIVINIAVFLLAFFLDFFELAFIIVPLLKPAAELIFRTAPEAIAIAKSLGMSVIQEKDKAGNLREVVADVGPFVIWLGVLLGVNMQTSFMHPPFGFALFYLRSVAPKAPYVDKVTGRTTEPVTTGQIYWGAVPFVAIQCFMVGLLIAVPWLAMHGATRHQVKQPASNEIELPGMKLDGPRMPEGLTLPPLMPGGPALPKQSPLGPPAIEPEAKPSIGPEAKPSIKPEPKPRSVGLSLPATPPVVGTETFPTMATKPAPSLDLSKPPSFD